MAATTIGRCRRVTGGLIALVVLLAATVSGAAAAGTTDIGVTAGSDSIDVGETTTVDIVVEDADGGVGALNATVTLSNPDAAAVERVTIHGDPGLNRVREQEDGVKLSAALADTEDSGSVTIATVVLRGESPGDTDIDVEIRTLGDEDGTAYEVADVERSAITVTERPDDADTPTQQPDAGSDGVSVTASAAPSDGSGTNGPPESGTESAPDAVSDAIQSATAPMNGLPSPVGPAGLLGVVLLGVVLVYRYR